MMIKAIFIDFDNTLYSHFSGQIPVSTIKALQEIDKKNVKIFLDTGRPINELKLFNLDEINFTGYILKNSQEIYDHNFNLLESFDIEGKLKQEIIKMFVDKVLPVNLCNTKGSYINYIDDTVKKVLKLFSTEPPEISEYKNDSFNMATIYVKDINEENEKLNHLKDIAELTHWNPHGISVVPKGMDKIYGIKYMLEKYQLKNEEIICFGDGHNDISMLEFATNGVAMGNASDDVKDKASYVTTHIDEDGIENALKHYGLV